MRRGQDQESVVDYFTRSGRLRRPPTQEDRAPADVLDYLSERAFTVYAAPRGEGEPKYVFQGQVVTIGKLLAIANEHRARMDLPPFQVGQQQ